MKNNKAFTSLIAVAACSFALIVAVGCSGASSSAATSSASGSSASASSAATQSSASASSATSTSQSASSASAASASGNSASTSSAASKQTADSQVFEGTVHVVSAEELIKLQNRDIDPAAAGNGGTYAVLVFDQPTQVTGMSADGSGQRTETANMLGIAEYTSYSSFTVEYGDLDMWKTYDGQHVKISAQASDIMFPSDVRLPIGEPSANKVELLS